jgi:hypothetical protein
MRIMLSDSTGNHEASPEKNTCKKKIAVYERHLKDHSLVSTGFYWKCSPFFLHCCWFWMKVNV